MPRTPPPRLLITALLALGVGLGGCATTNGDNTQAEEGEYDPLEPANRKVFDFNESLDEISWRRRPGLGGGHQRDRTYGSGQFLRQPRLPRGNPQ
ncbi:MAG: hypothetical protein U5L11_13985 [Arhodomonas sp.]|nr:hypothetical protein [Arhodomonas sp.]